MKYMVEILDTRLPGKEMIFNADPAQASEKVDIPSPLNDVSITQRTIHTIG
jgi:hypothetical protein